MTRTYCTSGSVRGRCRHRHRTIRTAYLCRLRDQRGCETQGGYSDRWGLRVFEDGEEVQAHESEKELWAFASEAFSA